jgi:hypothetical protein
MCGYLVGRLCDMNAVTTVNCLRIRQCTNWGTANWQVFACVHRCSQEIFEFPKLIADRPVQQTMDEEEVYSK